MSEQHVFMQDDGGNSAGDYDYDIPTELWEVDCIECMLPKSHSIHLRCDWVARCTNKATGYTSTDIGNVLTCDDCSSYAAARKSV